MVSYFPTVGVLGSGALVQLLDSPASSLGINLTKVEDEKNVAGCSVITAVGDSVSIAQVKTLEKLGALLRANSSTMEFVKDWNSRIEKDKENRFSVLVARSPHGQASAWTPTEAMQGNSFVYSVTPTPNLSAKQMVLAQRLALDIAKEAETVGVMEVAIILRGTDMLVGHLTFGPSTTGVWTIEGSRTSQFEQHLRAILDLPLGDPSLCARFTLSAEFRGERNMYRPYLHLMARSPGLKFHQYPSENAIHSGHVTALGADLLDLQECISHAVEYMNGVIDE